MPRKLRYDGWGNIWYALLGGMQNHEATIKHPGRNVLIVHSDVPGMGNASIPVGELCWKCNRGCTESISTPGTQVLISSFWYTGIYLDSPDDRAEFLRKICGGFKWIWQVLRVLWGGEWIGREIVDRVTHASRAMWPIRAVQNTIPYTWRRTTESKRAQTQTRAIDWSIFIQQFRGWTQALYCCGSFWSSLVGLYCGKAGLHWSVSLMCLSIRMYWHGICRAEQVNRT